MNRGQFSRQFLAVLSSTILAQLLNLASYPILSRLYSPEDFGLFGTFIATAAIPGVIACGRFDLVIATAPHAARRAVLWLCFVIAFAVAVISTAMISAWWYYTALPSAGILALMLFSAVLLTGIANGTTMFLMRHDNFRFASVGVVLRTATTVILQLGFAWVWPSPLGLIVGFCAGLAAQAVLGLWISSRSQGLGKPHQGQMRAMLRRFRGQVSVDLPGALIGAASLNLMPILLQYLFGIRAVGYYAMGQRIAMLPLQLFNNSFSQVFFQRAARAFDERGEFWSEFRFTLFWSGLVSLGMLLGMLFLARPALAIFLGPGWDSAATILMILAPMLAVQSVVSTLHTSVLVLRRPVWHLYHYMGSAAMIGVAVLIALITDTDMFNFLKLFAGLQVVESSLFFIAMTIAVRSQYLQRDLNHIY